MKAAGHFISRKEEKETNGGGYKINFLSSVGGDNRLPRLFIQGED
jgi:hypothetical protein